MIFMKLQPLKCSQILRNSWSTGLIWVRIDLFFKSDFIYFFPSQICSKCIAFLRITLTYVFVSGYTVRYGKLRFTKLFLQIFLIYKKISNKICKKILQIYLIYEKKYKNLSILNKIFIFIYILTKISASNVTSETPMSSLSLTQAIHLLPAANKLSQKHLKNTR